jgi:hypothetical protein
MNKLWRSLGTLLGLCGLLAACGGSGAPVTQFTPTLDVVQSAAAQATALVQQAQATALVLEARAQATALVEQARLAGGTPTSAVVNPPVYASPTPASGEATAPLVQVDAEPEPAVAATPEPTPVEVLSVGFAGEGGMIMIRFRASPDEAEKWWQGSVAVTDEGNDATYDEIPVMPKIGPLIGRPKIEGQAGYVMLVNAPPYLRSGALVTVILGRHEFEHVPVQ